MYREYREMSRTDAVETLYSDMAARHRARFRSIHVSQTPVLFQRTSCTDSPRSSASSSSRRPKTSSAPTSSSLLPRTSPSLSPTASPRRTPPRSSAPSVLPLSLKSVHGIEGWLAGFAGVYQGHGNMHCIRPMGSIKNQNIPKPTALVC